MARINVTQAGGPNVLAFLDMIAHSEGTAGKGDDGYNMIVGGALFQDYSQHPGRRVALKDKHGVVKLYSTAAGRYQFLILTWLNIARQHGLKDFNPIAQDQACIWLIRGAGAYDDIRAGRFALAVEKCKKIWASLPGAGYGQHENLLADLTKVYTQAGGTIV